MNKSGPNVSCKECGEMIHGRITFWRNFGFTAGAIVFSCIAACYGYVTLCTSSQNKELRQNSVAHVEEIHKNKENIIRLQTNFEYIRKGMDKQERVTEEILKTVRNLEK